MRDHEYEALFNQYNLALAQIKDLRDQMDVKTISYQTYSQKVDVIIDHVRELCEAILVKDSDEVALGTAKSWKSYSTEELILKAQKSFAKNNQRKTEMLAHIMDIAEERGIAVECLKEENEDLLSRLEKSREEYEQERTEQANKKAEECAVEKAKKKLAGDSEDEVSAVIVTLEDQDGIDEGAEIENAYEAQAVYENNVAVKLAENKGNKKERKKKKQREAVEKLWKTVDISSYHLSEEAINIIKIIGNTGLSRTGDIISVCSNQGIEERKARDAINELRTTNIISQAIPKTPGRTMETVNKLSLTGETYYKNISGEEPKTSQIDVIIAEHDNIEHGYGILALSEMLMQTGKYKRCDIYNRKNPVIVKTKEGEKEYIPDVFCETQNGDIEYYEYDRANHNQNSFNSKCDKMVKVTNYLNFVTNNKENFIQLQRQALAWYEGKNGVCYKNKYLRVTTFDALVKKEEWTLIIDLGKRKYFENGIEKTISFGNKR